MPDTLRWERLAHDDAGNIKTDWQDTYRAKVPGGWLVAIWANIERDETGDRKGSVAAPSTTTIAAGRRIPDGYWSGGLTFVSDPEHKWRATAYPKIAAPVKASDESTEPPGFPSSAIRKRNAHAMKRRNGRSSWIEQGLTTPVMSAIVDANHIAFGLTAETYDYTVTLAPAPAGPPWWRGTWKCKTDASQGHAQAKLYTASDGEIMLVGIWKEDGTDHYWVTELS